MTPQRQLAGFIDKFSPDVAAVARDAVRVMEKRLPGLKGTEPAFATSSSATHALSSSQQSAR